MPLNVLESGRRAIGTAVMNQLADDRARERRAAALDERSPHWFGADRPIRQVHGDAAMLIGGIRALLLQSLHPLAMAGFAEHSAYRSDPLGRLQRTGEFLGVTTFGTTAQAEAIIARVRRIHERVHGSLPDGRTYAASDPHLLRWVHVTEADSFLSAYQRYGAEPLDQAGRDGYVQDLAVVGSALGVIDPPLTEAEMRGQLASFRDELEGSPVARQAARFLFFKLPLPLPARPAFGVLAAAAVGLLPWWARWPLRLPLLPVSEATVVRVSGVAVTRTLRWVMQPLDEPVALAE
jgi:uncharacterized protein (DUF2236 family)